MLKIVFDLSTFESVELIALADAHVGNPLCDIGALKDIIEYINEEPEDPTCARVCLLNGDLTESVTRKSVGDIYGQTMSPQLQVATISEMLKPLAQPRDRYPMGKIISYCGGNHDVDRYKDTGITSAESIAVNLGLDDRYSSDGCYCFLKLGRKGNMDNTYVYTVYNQHMSGSAQSIGGKANRVARISNGVVADLIIGAHFHTPLTFKEDMILPNGNTFSITQKTITYLIVNAFLRFGDYGQRMGLKPSTISVPKIYIKQARESNRNGANRYFKTEVLL